MRALVRLVVTAALVCAQVWSVVAVAGLIGWGWTLLAVVACVVGGLVLVARQGASVARRARVDLLEGRPATDSAIDGLLVLAAGALLLVPGFLSAAAGFLLLVPPVRSRCRRPVVAWWERRVARGSGSVVGGSGPFPTGGFGFPPGSFRIHTVVVDGGFTTVGADDPFGRRTDGPVVEAEVIDVEVHRPIELPAAGGDPAGGDPGGPVADRPQ